MCQCGATIPNVGLYSGLWCHCIVLFPFQYSWCSSIPILVNPIPDSTLVPFPFQYSWCSSIPIPVNPIPDSTSVVNRNLWYTLSTDHHYQDTYLVCNARQLTTPPSSSPSPPTSGWLWWPGHPTHCVAGQQVSTDGLKLGSYMTIGRVSLCMLTSRIPVALGCLGLPVCPTHWLTHGQLVYMDVHSPVPVIITCCFHCSTDISPTARLLPPTVGYTKVAVSNTFVPLIPPSSLPPSLSTSPCCQGVSC